MNSDIWATSSEKVFLNMHKMCRFRLSCACAKYHQGLCSVFIHSVTMILFVDIECPDQTVQMCRLI